MLEEERGASRGGSGSSQKLRNGSVTKQGVELEGDWMAKREENTCGEIERAN